MSDELRLEAWLEEAVADCGYCGGPVRRCDRRGIVDDQLAHLDCVPRQNLTPGQRAGLMHLELVKVARDKFDATPNELERMAPASLRPDWPQTVIPTEALLAWARAERRQADPSTGCETPPQAARVERSAVRATDASRR